MLPEGGCGEEWALKWCLRLLETPFFVFCAYRGLFPSVQAKNTLAPCLGDGPAVCRSKGGIRPVNHQPEHNPHCCYGPKSPGNVAIPSTCGNWDFLTMFERPQRYTVVEASRCCCKRTTVFLMFFGATAKPPPMLHRWWDTMKCSRC